MLGRAHYWLTMPLPGLGEMELFMYCLARLPDGTFRYVVPFY